MPNPTLLPPTGGAGFWNPQPSDPRVFPDWMISGESGFTGHDSSAERLTGIESMPGSEARSSYWADGRRRIVVNSMLLWQEDMEAFECFQELTKAAHACLFYDSHQNRLTAEDIGTGNGTQTVFQVIQRISFMGVVKSRVVRHPNHQYPAISLRSGAAYRPTSYLQVFLAGVEQTTGWTVNRLTGQITFAAAPGNGVAVTCSGTFYNLVVLEDTHISLRADGAGSYSLASPFSLSEPEGLE